MEHRRPSCLSERQWRTARKIIDFVSAFSGHEWKALSIPELCQKTDLSERTVWRLLPVLTRHRIIGRRIKRIGRGHPALICVYPPDRQIDFPEPPRTPRVAAVLPAIRQALREDRESLRAVARRYGVSADTVQDERRKIAPYDPNSAQAHRCPGCGARISSPMCLRCSL